jgi:division protein CdvB (Snf7/Vps24/ESCRT-III family)
MYNPSLRQIPRHELADIIPLKQESSLIDWLESTHRLMERDSQEPDYASAEEDLAGIMDSDDTTYDDFDDDTDEVVIEED